MLEGNPFPFARPRPLSGTVPPQSHPRLTHPMISLATYPREADSLVGRTVRSYYRVLWNLVS